MYQRRLLLVIGVMTVMAIIPAAQMARLTLVKGEDLREQAERRLLTETWTETTRGRILDRRGREIARDRPSYDILVDYSVITGRWAENQAARAARRAVERAGRTWAQIGREEREELIGKQLPVFKQHLDQMWARFSSISGATAEQIEDRRREIIDQVQYLAATVTERQRLLEQERLSQRRGEPVELSTSDVRVTIQEQRQPHAVLRDVPDTIGLEFDRLRDLTSEDDELYISSELAATVPGGKPLPIMPGLHVRDATRRDYPYEVSDVDMDMGSMPPPLRSKLAGKSGADSVDVRTIRVEGVARHVLGRQRNNLFREDLERRPRVNPQTGETDRGHYRPGDSVGHGGIEQAKEDVLRGLRGVRVRHLDTGKEDVTPAERGQDVQSTIDIALQARIQALFAPELGLTVVQPWQKPQRVEQPRLPGDPQELPIGTPLHGAVVVIDVESGDVLAMVSHPSYSLRQIESSPESILRDEYSQTFINRAVAKAYPPGSIVKPLVLAEAEKAGKYRAGEQIRCTGHFFPNTPLLYRCWIYKQFKTTHSDRLGHDLDGAEAVKCSCNIFFFEMGQRLGPTGMHRVYQDFGVGPEATRFNLFQLPTLPTDPIAREEESRRRGLLYEAWGDMRSETKMTSQEAILLGIGQGPITWTPLHAANAYATLARGGVSRTPRLFMDAEQEVKDLGFSSRSIREALKGLKGSATEDNGTTHQITYSMPDGSRTTEPIFNAKGVTVWAKSGTADTNPFRADLDQSGGREEYDGDHAWCVLLAGEGDVPKYAIACVVDYGGSGGRVAGPLANQVVHALAAEGYLPKRQVLGDTPESQRSVQAANRPIDEHTRQERSPW